MGPDFLSVIYVYLLLLILKQSESLHIFHVFFSLLVTDQL
jgi:hypothetical protein